MTSAKRESIFKVPDGVSSKVGVVGSGKGMTDFQRKGRHEFSLDD
jgi:survival-of-motor-neuron-related-splicing factor 30